MTNIRGISEIRTVSNGLGTTMRFTNLLFVALRILLLSGVTSEVLGIQNDRTSSRSPQDNMILSASAYTGPEKTSNFDLHNDKSFRFDRTVPAFQLESSRSLMNDINTNEETKLVFEEMNDEMIDGLTSSKHIDQFDGNNIEVKPGEYYHIAATKSETFSGEGQGAPQGQDLSTEPQQPVQSSMDHPAQIFHTMDQERQARQGTPQSYSEHAPPPIISASSGRQANPDIQDIITGIVKLLNGNVNVAANTVRPLRPVQATRINNRGPPRIADVPPLPIDFDTAGMNPPPLPDQPYPFEKPPAPDRTTNNQINNQLSSERPIKPFLDGIPVPEQIVPQDNRIWTRPYNRPGGTRRPIPPYKPLPPLDSSFHREGDKQPEKSSGDSTTTEMQDVGESSPNKVENHQHSQETTVVNEESANHKEVNYNNKINDSNKQKQTPSNDSAITKQTELEPSTKDQVLSSQTIDQKTLDYPKPVIPLISSTETSSILQHAIETSKGPTITDISPTKSEASTSKVFSTTTLKIETSSSVQVIEPASTKSSSVVSSSTITLKNNSKKTDVNAPDSTSLSPSPTEKLENTPSLTSSISTPALPVSPSFTQTSTLISNTIDKSIKYTTSSTFSKKFTGSTDIYSYRPRPGIVLDDTLDYTGSQGLATQRPYGPQRHPSIGDIFDVTVSAIQGPGSAGNSIEGVRVPVHTGGTDVILTSAIEGQGFVSIDGKRTYLNLFDTTDRSSVATQVQPQPTRTQHPPIIGTGVAVPQPDVPTPHSRPSGGPIRRPIFHRRPTQPPVRIDTCIVGDTSTCDASQHEACATVQGVSACHCKPGYARLQHSLPCKKIISIVVSMRVDRIYEEKRKVVWNEELADKDSELYQTLAYEANRAIESAMSMTPFSDEYMGSLINNIYEGDISQGQGGVFVNTTLKLLYEPRTSRPSLAGELQRHLRGVIERRNNNIGKSALYVDSPPGSISNLQDLDECASSELNDCHSLATCTNSWGGFTCVCNPGFKDPHKDDPNDSGRTCLSCPSTYCNNRGTCSYQNDQMQCTCAGNYYGAQCEVDGEVLGVAIGASVAALIIIILTLVGLIMWSRRWSREQKAMGSPVYGYIQGGIHGTLPGTLARVGSVGTLASVKQGPPTNLPPYMWAHFTDHMATANVYATEPMGPTRPSSAIFGYPPMNVHGTLPPVPLPRLQAPPRPRQRQQPDPDSSDSELQDKDRADLIPQHNAFHVPRPKSRSSLANQSGIYNDVEYDQGDVQHLSKNNIPLSTYRPYYRT